MGSLLGSIISTSSTLRAFSQGLNVVQNNVANANTPGFVKQTQDFNVNPFDITRGLTGGVSIGKLLNSRNEFAEQAVRNQQSASASADQRAGDLQQLEPIFDLSSESGISGSLSKLFDSFSQLSVAPNSNPSRQQVLDRASQVAQAINQSAGALSNASGAADTQIKNSVDGINRLLDKIATLNAEYRKGSDAAQNPSLDADIHRALEELSQLIDFSATKADDGSFTIQIGGQTTAVIGDHAYKLGVDLSGAQAKIQNAQGIDISAQITSGRVRGLLDERNITIPSYLSDLNDLAAGLADAVNAGLANGLDANGNVPTVPLFTYDPVNGAALTLATNKLAPSDIAAAAATAPGGNGNALALADLGKSKQPNGFTFVEAYGNLAGHVGRDVAAAQSDQQTFGALLTQAQSFRSDSSGVSLDEEAANLIQFQKGYQAAAKLISVLNDLTDTLIGIIR
ncbi:MAG: flagellar hook-associated protein FlgK [Bryobacteraceae bacterium]